MGSFTHAADSLGTQKGRVSTAVRKLEEDAGARLLHRTTRSVQLTEGGRVFHARARHLFADVDDLHLMFASDRAALRGRLRVDLPREVAGTTIVPALPAFMATYPELELELEVSSTDRQVDLVQEGFGCGLRLGSIGDETLRESATSIVALSPRPVSDQKPEILLSTFPLKRNGKTWICSFCTASKSSGFSPKALMMVGATCWFRTLLLTIA